jgi:hypothetical protein
VAAHTRRFLGKQMRAFRGERSQVEFAEYLGEPQSSISTLEKAGPGTLTKALKIAKKLRVAVLFRFVDFDAFKALTEDQSDNALAPPPFDEARELALPTTIDANSVVSLFRFGESQEEELIQGTRPSVTGSGPPIHEFAATGGR